MANYLSHLPSAGPANGAVLRRCRGALSRSTACLISTEAARPEPCVRDMAGSASASNMTDRQTGQHRTADRNHQPGLAHWRYPEAEPASPSLGR